MIIHPVNKIPYSIFSKTGRTLLKLYINNFKNGGTESYTYDDEFTPPEGYEYDMYESLSRITNNTTDPAKEKSETLSMKDRMGLVSSVWSSSNKPSTADYMLALLPTATPSDFITAKPVEDKNVPIAQVKNRCINKISNRTVLDDDDTSIDGIDDDGNEWMYDVDDRAEEEIRRSAKIELLKSLASKEFVGSGGLGKFVQVNNKFGEIIHFDGEFFHIEYEDGRIWHELPEDIKFINLLNEFWKTTPFDNWNTPFLWIKGDEKTDDIYTIIGLVDINSALHTKDGLRWIQKINNTSYKIISTINDNREKLKPCTYVLNNGKQIFINVEGGEIYYMSYIKKLLLTDKFIEDNIKKNNISIFMSFKKLIYDKKAISFDEDEKLIFLFKVIFNAVLHKKLNIILLFRELSQFISSSYYWEDCPSGSDDCMKYAIKWMFRKLNDYKEKLEKNSSIDYIGYNDKLLIEAILRDYIDEDLLNILLGFEYNKVKMLHLAIRYNNINLVQYLLEKGVKKNNVYENKTPLETAVTYFLGYHPIVKKKLDIIELLFNKGFDMEHKDSLYKLIIQSDFSYFDEKNKEFINGLFGDLFGNGDQERQKNLQEYLKLAIYNNNLYIVKLLLNPELRKSEEMMDVNFIVTFKHKTKGQNLLFYIINILNDIAISSVEWDKKIDNFKKKLEILNELINNGIKIQLNEQFKMCKTNVKKYMTRIASIVETVVNNKELQNVFKDTDTFYKQLSKILTETDCEIIKECYCKLETKEQKKIWEKIIDKFNEDKEVKCELDCSK